MDYTKLATKETVGKTIEALKKNNISAQFVETKEQALEALKNLLPAGAELMAGSSTTLEQVGFIDLLKSGNHLWKNLKNAILAEKDPAKQSELRKQSALARYFIASVHAVTEDGRTITASGSGSQLPSYVYTSENVIWVAGTHKIVPSLEDGLKRVREYCLPLEDQRMKNLGYGGSRIGKMLIFEYELNPKRKINLILVNEILGF